MAGAAASLHKKARAVRNAKKALFITAFISPAILLIILYAYLPIFATFRYSFTSWNGFSLQMPWVGLQNYVRLLQDTVVLHAFVNNLMIVAVSLLIQLPLAFMAAYATFILRNRWAEFFKVLYFIPGVLSMVMIGLMWTFIYDYQRGPVNAILRAVGLTGWAKAWLGDPNFAIFAVLIAIVWAYFGQHCIIHSAGLNSLSVEVLEAARIDGASGIKAIWMIIIPMMSEILRVTIILALIGSFKYFDLVYTMTGGGPFHRSDVLANYMYNRAFQAREFGYGGAIAVLILVCALFGTVVQMFWQRENSEG